VSALLVVAGEASGDRAAAGVIARLDGVHAFGMGGAALAANGVELLADLRESTAMGVGEVASRAWGITRAFRRLARAVGKRAPRAALLVNYTEFNMRLARRLRAARVRVLWYVAPQVWAWRPGRVAALRRHVDRLAVILPFEEALWRSHGVDARYVGHPVREATPLDRSAARYALGLTPFAHGVAIMPGSRPHEVRRLLAPLLEGYEKLRRDRASIDGRVLLAPSLDPSTRAFATALAAAHRVPTFDVDPHVGSTGVLSAFDVAATASGTASLEAALARAVPVVAYRVGLTTELFARAFLRTPYMALPNVLLQRPAFAELAQREVRSDRIARALAHAIDARETFLAHCDEVDAALGDRRSPSDEVARMLTPWL
jgi:lipid-A-disaccharide synthase